jgi:hypothetical protein
VRFIIERNIQKKDDVLPDTYLYNIEEAIHLEDCCVKSNIALCHVPTVLLSHFFFFFFFPLASPSSVSPLSAASSFSLLEPSPVIKSVNF